MQAINQSRNEKDARYYFVECQLRPNQVYNPVLLNAALFVNRENYLPAAYRSIAYADTCLSITENRWALSPFVLMRLINLIDPQPGQKILTIGCGMGYSLAVLKALGTQAYGVEENPQLCKHATQVLKEDYQIVDHVLCGAHNQGWLEESPFDAILIEGAVEVMPSALLAQVREGGQIVGIKRFAERVCQAGSWRVIEGRPLFKSAFDVSVPILSGFNALSKFTL